MAPHLRSQGTANKQFPPISDFASVPTSSLKSAPVMETFWRRRKRGVAGRVIDDSRGSRQSVVTRVPALTRFRRSPAPAVAFYLSNKNRCSLCNRPMPRAPQNSTSVPFNAPDRIDASCLRGLSPHIEIANSVASRKDFFTRNSSIALSTRCRAPMPGTGRRLRPSRFRGRAHAQMTY
jgi:hypothetical protein